MARAGVVAVTDADRLNAILDRLGVIETNSATAHAKIEGGINVLTERVSTLAEKVAIQNGRVTKAEHRISELETQRRIDTSHETEDEARGAVISTRVWGLLTGSFLVILGAVIGYWM